MSVPIVGNNNNNKGRAATSEQPKLGPSDSLITSLSWVCLCCLNCCLLGSPHNPPPRPPRKHPPPRTTVATATESHKCAKKALDPAQRVSSCAPWDKKKSGEEGGAGQLCLRLGSQSLSQRGCRPVAHFIHRLASLRDELREDWHGPYLCRKMELWRKFSKRLTKSLSSLSRFFSSSVLGQAQHGPFSEPARSDFVRLVFSSGSRSPVAGMRIGVLISVWHKREAAYI